MPPARMEHVAFERRQNALAIELQKLQTFDKWDKIFHKIYFNLVRGYLLLHICTRAGKCMHTYKRIYLSF